MTISAGANRSRVSQCTDTAELCWRVVSFNLRAALRWRCSCHLEFTGEQRLRAVSVWYLAELGLGLSYPAPGPGHLTLCHTTAVHGPTGVRRVIFPGDLFSESDLSL